MSFYKIVLSFYKEQIPFGVTGSICFFIAIVLRAKCDSLFILWFLLLFVAFFVVILGIVRFYIKMRDFSFKCPKCAESVAINLWQWKSNELKKCNNCGHEFKKDYEFESMGAPPSPIYYIGDEK